MKRPLVTLTTDFGTVDGYVGAMKGVLLSRCPGITIVDITHDIPPQDIISGAMALVTACPFFPEDTIHVAVVDPGVGGERKPMIARAGGHWWVGPDNGLLSYIHQRTPIEVAYEITAPEFCREEVSHTFHGRDIFAPTAAALAMGVHAENAGPAIEAPILFEVEEPLVDGVVHGQVVHVDRYGNLVTNISKELISPDAQVCLEQHELGEIMQSYSQVKPGEALALMSSAGQLEISIRDGSAAAHFKLDRKARVIVKY